MTLKPHGPIVLLAFLVMLANTAIPDNSDIEHSDGPKVVIEGSHPKLAFELLGAGIEAVDEHTSQVFVNFLYGADTTGWLHLFCIVYHSGGGQSGIKSQIGVGPNTLGPSDMSHFPAGLAKLIGVFDRPVDSKKPVKCSLSFEEVTWKAE